MSEEKYSSRAVPRKQGLKPRGLADLQTQSNQEQVPRKQGIETSPGPKLPCPANIKSNSQNKD